MIHLGETELHRLIPVSDMVPGLARLLIEPTQLAPRQRISDPMGREFLIMPAMSSRYAIVKALTIVAGNEAAGYPIIQGTATLFELEYGRALATMDADPLTSVRTAGASGLAARQLARKDARHLLILGSGRLIPWLCDAFLSVRPIRSIAVWARDRSKASATAHGLRSRWGDLEVQIVDDLPGAVAKADIISAATRASAPILAGDWLRPGTHVDLVGGYRPDMREIDDVGLARSSVFVDTREGALREAGDLIDPIRRGKFDDSRITGDLSDLAAGTGRVSDDEITLFKSVGNAALDLAAAQMAWAALS